MRHTFKECHFQRFALILGQSAQHDTDFIDHKFLGSRIFQIDSSGDGQFSDVIFRMSASDAR